MKIDNLLKEKPFSISNEKKKALFKKAIKESLIYHYNNCELFKRFIDKQEFDVNSDYEIEDIPYLPISIFKELDLITGPKEEIKTIILSSSTTSNKPSRIHLDKINMKRQQIALKNIMSNLLGEERMDFIVFDKRSTVLKDKNNTSSRASAIRGMAPFAKSMNFILNEDLEFDHELFKKAFDSVGDKNKVCFFGFTWLVYKIYLSIIKDEKKISLFKEGLNKIKAEKKVLHIGGWKKLKDISISKNDFNSKISNFLNIDKDKIIDFYGMTEQLGTVYPDCEEGYKHISLYSDIIIRDPKTLEPLGVGKPGLIQFLTPLPHSYPGISILTEDIGEIIGVNGCKCGRKGKYFVFKKRIEKAPIKGCGDTL